MSRKSILLLPIIVLLSCTQSTSTQSVYTLQGVVISDYDDSFISGSKIYVDDLEMGETDAEGRFSIVDLESGEYRFKAGAVEDHKSLQIERVSLFNSNFTLTIRLPLKYNLIQSISSSNSVDRATNLVGSFKEDKAPAILDDNSRLTLLFQNFISATDTIEFAYYHTEQPGLTIYDDVLFEHGLNLKFEDTDFDDNLIIANYNDEVVRTIKMFPTALEGDSSRVLELRVIPNTGFSIEELNLLYFTSY